MGKLFTSIDDDLAGWIGRQKIFFVSTAPLSADGLINCSPKGLDSFRIFGPTDVGYLDLTGSGIETVAHLRENGRIVLMFCAFDGPPRIVRLHGTGRAILPGDAEFNSLKAEFPNMAGARSIIRIAVARIADSCGYGVPRFDFVEDRDTLVRWAETKGPAGVVEYQRKKNAASLDGLPGLPASG